MTIEIVGLFLAVAVLVALGSARLKVPYTIGLVVAGAVLALSPISHTPTLTKELVFTLLLPPLVFEAAFLLRWKDFKSNVAVAVPIASVGLLGASAIVAWAMVSLAGWPIQAAIVFAVLISATDPVSVIATMKEAGIGGRLRVLVESESLLNDGVAAVAFGLAVAFGMTGEFNGAEAIFEFFKVAFGGIAVGGLVAGASLLVAGRTEDHLVEIAITTLAAFGSFLLAEKCHLSGVLATVTAGMMVGNLGHFGPITAKGHKEVESFWEFGAFLANSFIFLLIGVQEAHENFLVVLLPLGVAIVSVLVGRAAAVYGLCGLFGRSRYRVSGRHQFVLFWGGLRGALALALALGLPADFPMAKEIQTITAGVVAFSIVIQGLTMTPILKRTAEDDSEEIQGEMVEDSRGL